MCAAWCLSCLPSVAEKASSLARVVSPPSLSTHTAFTGHAEVCSCHCSSYRREQDSSCVTKVLGAVSRERRPGSPKQRKMERSN